MYDVIQEAISRMSNQKSLEYILEEAHKVAIFKSSALFEPVSKHFGPEYKRLLQYYVDRGMIHVPRFY